MRPTNNIIVANVPMYPVVARKTLNNNSRNSNLMSREVCLQILDFHSLTPPIVEMFCRNVNQDGDPVYMSF